MTALVIIAVGGVFLIALNAALDGFVFSVLWGWFIVPTFHAPEITIINAVGIALVVGSLISVRSSSNTQGDEDAEFAALVKDVGWAVLRPVALLLMGWIAHQFM